MVSLQFGARLSGPLLGFMNRDAEPRPCSLFDSAAKKTKAFFTFLQKKKKKKKSTERESKREGEREGEGHEEERKTVVLQPLPYSFHMQGLEAGNTHNSM